MPSVNRVLPFTTEDRDMNKWWIACGAGAVLLGAVQGAVAAPQGDPARAEWMAGRHGMMVHYLVTPQGNTPEEKTADFNRTIDGFDLDAFMGQFEQSGAEWLIFTIGQNTGYYASPNPVLDELLPGHTPRRDLVVEIARRVDALGKRFVAYLPVETTTPPEEVRRAFAWNPDDQSEYFKRYLGFIRAYAEKLGPLCDGWWFDGCYEPVTKGQWDWAPWCEAARAGNPRAAIAFNDGAFCTGWTEIISPLQDYHPGEVHLLEDGQIRFDFLGGDDVYATPEGHLRKPGQEPKYYMPDGQFVHGVQWHALVPIHSTFNPAVPVPDYPDAMLLGFMRTCMDLGGGVTLNLPIGMDGRIPDAAIGQFIRMTKGLGESPGGQH
jgi:hypothetical protein